MILMGMKYTIQTRWKSYSGESVAERTAASILNVTVRKAQFRLDSALIMCMIAFELRGAKPETR
jgi:hypothetical protein